MRKKWTKKYINTILKLIEKGHDISEISNFYGITRATLYRNVGLVEINNARGKVKKLSPV